MRAVSELYGRHPESDIFVVGSGTSMRVFPRELLAGRITIGLNMAWKLVDTTYGITIHPGLNIPELMPDEDPRPAVTWITKPKWEGLNKTQIEWIKRECYLFDSYGRPNSQPPGEPRDEGRMVEWVHSPVGDKLYQWSSISQTAVNLAANMGARNIFLVGCDMTSLAGNHHGHKQHTRWLGVTPDHRYRQFWEGLLEVRSALRSRGVSLVNLSPFLGLGRHEEEFEILADELGVPQLLVGEDISPAMSAGDRLRRLLGRRQA
jgi:hypothetical protein